ncbi:MAG: Bro-N domain-containing protein [Magnetococcus sp. YQC-3]
MMAVSQSAPQSAPINQLIPLDFEEHAVRVTLDEHGAPWFHAGDVCRVLGFGNPRQAVESHVDEDDVQKLDAVDSLGRTQQANYINESGLYALIFGSTKPEAKRFKRWVTQEVLPAIRKTGGYGKADAAISENLARVLQGLEQVVQALDNTGDLDSIAQMPRQELRLSHRRILSFQQAIRPIHIEYGKVWTTSLAISEKCQVSHAHLLRIVDEMLFLETIQRRDHDRVWYLPDRARIAQQVHCLTESGFRALWQRLEQNTTAEERANTNLDEGCQLISRMFESSERAGGRGQKWSPAKGPSVKVLSELAMAAAELANATARSGRHG